MANKKRDISNSTSPLNTTLSKKFFTFMNFFPPHNCIFNLTKGRYKITFVSKRKVAANINISKILCDLTWNSW